MSVVKRWDNVEGEPGFSAPTGEGWRVETGEIMESRRDKSAGMGQLQEISDEQGRGDTEANARAGRRTGIMRTEQDGNR